MWPFPGDALDLTFGWVEVVLGVLFAVLWPLWLLAKYFGVRWVITIQRDRSHVGPELAGGWGKSVHAWASPCTRDGAMGTSAATAVSSRGLRGTV